MKNKKLIIILALFSFLILSGVAVALFIPENGTYYPNIPMDGDPDMEFFDRMPDCKIGNNNTRHCVFERCLGSYQTDWDDLAMQSDDCIIMYKNDTVNEVGSNGSQWNDAINVSGEWDVYPEALIDRNPVISIYQEKYSDSEEIFIAWQRYYTYEEIPFWSAWQNWFSRSVDGNWSFEEPVMIVPNAQVLATFTYDNLEIDCEHDEQGYVWCAWMSDWNTTCAGSFNYWSDDMSDCSWTLFATKLTDMAGDQDDWRQPANGTCSFGDLDPGVEYWFSWCAFPQVEPYNSTVDGTSSVHLVAEFYNMTIPAGSSEDEMYGKDVIYVNASNLDNLPTSWGQFALVLADGVYGDLIQNGTAYARPRFDADRIGGDLQIGFLIHNKTLTEANLKTDDVRFIEMPNPYESPSNIFKVTNDADIFHTMPDVANDWRDTTTLGWVTYDSTVADSAYINFTNKSAYSLPDAWNTPYDNASTLNYDIRWLLDEHTPLTVSQAEGNNTLFAWHHYEEPLAGVIDYNISTTSWNRNFTQPLCANPVDDSMTFYGNMLSHNSHKSLCNDDGINIQADNLAIHLSGYRVYGNQSTPEYLGFDLNSYDNINISRGWLGFFGTGMYFDDSDSCKMSEIVNGVHNTVATFMTTNSDNNVFKNCTFQGSALGTVSGIGRVFTNLYINDSDNNLFEDVYLFNSRQGGAVIVNPVFTNAYVRDSNNNTFDNASSFFTLAESKHIHTGIYIDNSTNNTIQRSYAWNSYIATLINRSSGNLLTNNTYLNNNISVYLLNASFNNTLYNESFNYSSLQHINDSTSNVYQNLLTWQTVNGSIKWIDQNNLDVEEGEYKLGLGNNINLTANRTEFNSEYFASLNDGGCNLSFFDTDSYGYGNRTPMVNDTKCEEPDCVELDDADTYVYNISHFSFYGVGEGGTPPAPSVSNLTVVINSPANDSIVCTTGEFCFTVVDLNSSTVNCTLFMNSTWEWTNETVANNTQTCATPNSSPLDEGEWNFYFNCTDGSDYNTTGVYEVTVTDCTECPQNFMLAIFVSLAIVAFIFAYLFVNTNHYIGYLWLGLVFGCILIGMQSVRLISETCGCCGYSSFATLYDGLYIAMIVSIVVVVFYIIYRIFLDRALDKLAKQEKADNLEEDWEDL